MSLVAVLSIIQPTAGLPWGASGDTVLSSTVVAEPARVTATSSLISAGRNHRCQVARPLPKKADANGIWKLRDIVVACAVVRLMRP